MTAANIFQVYFDGGTDGANGFNQNGYGSWQVDFNGFSKKVSRQPFLADGVGHVVTCNVAEWLALKCALMWFGNIKHRERYTVNIFGDSKLVVKQLNGDWKTNNSNMADLKAHCLHYLQGFNSWSIKWHSRNNNVERFGH